MKIVLIAHMTYTEGPCSVDTIVARVEEHTPSILVAPDQYFCRDSWPYTPRKAKEVMLEIADRTKESDAIIIPGTFSIRGNDGNPIAPIIYRGRIAAEHRKNSPPSTYHVGGLSLAVSICSELEHSHRSHGTVDIHVIPACGIYPDEVHIDRYPDSFRAREGGLVLWTDGTHETVLYRLRYFNFVV